MAIFTDINIYRFWTMLGKMLQSLWVY